jgi:hypothetical protein
VQDHYIYDYAVIRVVPRVEREEFINAGIILSCPEKEFLDAVIKLDEKKIKAFDPKHDIEITRSHLSAIKEICMGGSGAGNIGNLSQRERFHLLTSPKSTIIQTSAVHSGYCKDPAKELKHLLETMVGTNN